MTKGPAFPRSRGGGGRANWNVIVTSQVGEEKISEPDGQVLYIPYIDLVGGSPCDVNTSDTINSVTKPLLSMYGYRSLRVFDGAF